MPHEKSLALLMTAERAERSSVFVISRTIPSSRLLMMVVKTGSNELSFPVVLATEELVMLSPSVDSNDEMTNCGHSGGHAWINYNCRRRLFDDCWAINRCTRLQFGTAVDRRFNNPAGAEES
jgi:hypothetical protein